MQRSCLFRNVLFLLCFTWSLQALAQTPVRLTFHTGHDELPAWDPRNQSIAYLRNKVDGDTSFNGPFDVYEVQSDGSKNGPLLIGPSLSFSGVALDVRWVGSTGTLLVSDTLGIPELLLFDTSSGPFTRTVFDGTEGPVRVGLTGPSGGLIYFSSISRDGNTALVRESDFGAFGNVRISSGPTSTLLGQASSSFGTTNLFENIGSSALKYGLGVALSPDGSRFILPIETFPGVDQRSDLWLFTTDNSVPPQQLTTVGGSEGLVHVNPEYSPDGTRVIFSRAPVDFSSASDLYVMNVNGTGLVQITNSPGFAESQPSWAPDGSAVAFAGIHFPGQEDAAPALEAGEGSNFNIYVLQLAAQVIATPKTTPAAPVVVVNADNTVTISLQDFISAATSLKKNKKARAQALALAIREIAQARRGGPKTKSTKLKFKYEVVITRVTGAAPTKADITRLTSKRNSITVGRDPGTYSVNYRLAFTSNGKPAGKSKFSPSTTFTVPG